GKLICASNENKVLFDFFQTGTYDRNREFVLTSSPSMDILISSNLERLIYYSAGGDANKNASLMKELAQNGRYAVTEEMREAMRDFLGGYATEEETFAEIRRVYASCGYVLDTHTAVASSVYHEKFAESSKDIPVVIASTASPYKFARSVMTAIDDTYAPLDDFALIEELHKISGTSIPRAIEEIRNAPVLHDTVINKDEMKAAVKRFLLSA
ncbi:MAG: threonine synthase, partial [Lachnospiraceae bacterium]|nr:threonine synthase [Lachnospiraceae bacterium]